MMPDCMRLVNILLENHMTICTAESCTGGLLSSAIVDVPGASDVFGRGFITYANEAKHDLLGVTWEALNAYGAVSRQVAEQMAQGAAAKASVGVGITGIAGPGGGTPEKPVGLVYIGCHVKGAAQGASSGTNQAFPAGTTFVEECHFSGDRRTVRESAAAEAVGFVLRCLEECGIS